jgi:hypothetical protein
MLLTRQVRRFVTVMLVLGVADPASAADQNWEVEVHGGYVLSSKPSSGTGALPGTNSASASTVPSWYFGDGALVLNQALTSIRLSPSIVALDSVLKSPFVERRPGGSVGIRIGRVLTPRFTAEFTLDEGFGALAVTPTSQKAIEATRASFVTAWSPVLSSPSRGSATVTSLATIGDREGRQRFATGALLINLTSGGRLKPYAAFGAGVIAGADGAPAAQLVGSYQFGLALPPGSPVPGPMFHETDTVTVRSSVDNAFTGVLGGGFKYALSEHWGVRADVRDYISRNRVDTVLTATPTSEMSPGSGVLIIFSTPPLRFSASPTTPSTLGGTPVAAFTTFYGTGIRNQVKGAAGLFWRF